MKKEITLNDILLVITDIKSNMVTKEDAKHFVTKEDIGEIKEELKQHTEDIRGIKEELKQHTEDIREIKEELKEHKEILNQHTKDFKKIKKNVSEIKFVINGLADDIGMLDARTRSLVVYKTQKKTPINL